MCYVLIGYWSTPEEDMFRIEKLREMRIDPFVMPYDKSDPYQRAFARWVNFKAIFKSIPWSCYRQTRIGNPPPLPEAQPAREFQDGPGVLKNIQNQPLLVLDFPDNLYNLSGVGTQPFLDCSGV